MLRVGEALFLGFWDEQPCFVSQVEEPDAAIDTGSLYRLLGRVDDELFALAGRAAQLLAWQREQRFCSRCGGGMVEHPQERAVLCSACERTVYPHIAPCAIVLVTRGEDLLLARSPHFPAGMYSALAGFVEAGESVEQAVTREVQEEVGIRIDRVRYVGSQSWPFPNQLMLGFMADYAGGELTPDPQEIEHADWWHHSALPQIPSVHAIAGQLIRQFINTFHPR